MNKKEMQLFQAALDLTPPWGHEYVEPTFACDVDATFSLIASLHDYQRAQMCRLLYKARISPEAFRVALEEAWTQSHHYSDVLREARGWSGLIRWCTYASFPVPEDLPDPITIYRGAQGVKPFDAVFAPSWTLSIETAKWFATRSPERSSVVVAGEVPRSAIVFYSNAREEQEVIPEAVPRNYMVLLDDPGNV